MKSNEIVMSVDYREKAVKFLSFVGIDLEKHEAERFVELASELQLNPYKREIYPVKYGKKFSIVTGYEVYIRKAEATGKLTGFHVEVKGSLVPFNTSVRRKGENGYYEQKVETWKADGECKATITIYRKGWDKPFSWDVDFDEYNQMNEMWNSKPKTMLKKVACAQGFRLCFQGEKEIDDLPYIEDEYTEQQNVTDAVPVVKGVEIVVKDTESEKLYLELEIALQEKFDKNVITEKTFTSLLTDGLKYTKGNGQPDKLRELISSVKSMAKAEKSQSDYKSENIDAIYSALNDLLAECIKNKIYSDKKVEDLTENINGAYEFEEKDKLLQFKTQLEKDLTTSVKSQDTSKIQIMKDKILSGWEKLGYHDEHIKNSLKENLGVITIHEVNDAAKLIEYYQHLVKVYKSKQA